MIHLQVSKTMLVYILVKNRYVCSKKFNLLFRWMRLIPNNRIFEFNLMKHSFSFHVLNAMRRIGFTYHENYPFVFEKYFELNVWCACCMCNVHSLWKYLQLSSVQKLGCSQSALWSINILTNDFYMLTEVPWLWNSG